MPPARRTARMRTRRAKIKMTPPFMLSAIDSGAKGAIAMLYVKSRTEIEIMSVNEMPRTSREPLPHIRVNDLVDIISDADYVTVEAVRPIKGRTTLDKAMMQGGSYYPIGDALERLGLLDKTFMTADNAQDWKKLLGVSGKVDGNEKTKTYNLICGLFPDKIDLFIGERGGKLYDKTDAVAIGLACIKQCVE